MKQTYTSDLSREDYQALLEEAKSKLVIGPREKYRDETDEQYRYRRWHFIRTTEGFISMIEHQLGLKEVYLRFGGRE